MLAYLTYLLTYPPWLPGAVDAAMRRLQPQLSVLRQQMREAARELLFEEEGSRVAHNTLLEYAGDCAPGPLPGE